MRDLKEKKNMKRKTKMKKLAVMWLALLLMAGMLSACGKTKDVDTDEEESITEEDEADNSGDEKEPVENADPHGLDVEGEWVMVYSLFHSEYGEGEEYDSCTMTSDEYSSSSSVNIKVEDGKYIADYIYSGYESEYRYYGAELEYKDEPAYEDCDNKDWCLEMTDPYDASYYNRKFTMADDGMLISVSEYFDEDEEDDYDYYSVTRDVYLKSTDPRLENEEELRYFDTVEVSDATELINSLQNNRKLILKAGTYDLSLVDDEDVTNKSVYLEWGEYRISDIHNVCLEAEEGVDVLICVDDAYSPVISFENSGNLTFRGITAGHNVEPGYCSGSVLRFNSTYGINIDKCNLYGCGTYGIEADNCDNLEVTDTDIYECTYGLLDLSGVYNANFKNCMFRDSSDMSMILLNSSYNITFDDCTFKNNKIDPEYSTFSAFVNLSEYADATFNNCTFRDNQYKIFANNKVKMNNCQISDNGDMSNIETEEDADASEIRRRYKDTSDQQAQIDLKFEAGNMDQATINQTAFESYNMWDTLLNDIWAYLKETLDEDKMEALTAEEKEWVKQKEESVKEAAAGFEGGTMQPAVEYVTGAELTRERVEYLLENYVK